MANGTSVPVTDLVPTSSVLVSTATSQACTFDTGTQATASVDVGGLGKRVVLELQCGTTDTIGVSIAAGSNPPANRKGMGAYAKTGLVTSGRWMLGPYESARFIGTDGKMTITVSSDTTNVLSATARAWKVPMV